MAPSLLVLTSSPDALKFSLFPVERVKPPLLYGSVRNSPSGFVFRVKVAETRHSDLVILSPFADIGLAAVYVVSWISLNFGRDVVRACAHSRAQAGPIAITELRSPKVIEDSEFDISGLAPLEAVTKYLWQQFPFMRQFTATNPSQQAALATERPENGECEIAQQIANRIAETVSVCA